MTEADFTDLAEHRQIDRPPLLALADWRREGRRSSLLTIMYIDGKSPRSLGAQMAVEESGILHGYLTGGCLERELALVAQELMRDGRNDLRRYGRGSRYVDMRLPCGSGIDIYFDQTLPDAAVFEAVELIESRVPFALSTDLALATTSVRRLSVDAATAPQAGLEENHFERLVKPRLRLNLYGAGFAAVQLAFFAQNAGFEVNFATSDDITIAAAAAMGVTAKSLWDADFAMPAGDAWTASMLMFHEHEREGPILEKLLFEPGFYIGAIGSKVVSQQRIDTLLARSVAREAIDRITMPAGFVKGARNATEIAVGVLAEMLDRARANHLVV